MNQEYVSEKLENRIGGEMHEQPGHSISRRIVPREHEGIGLAHHLLIVHRAARLVPAPALRESTMHIFLPKEILSASAEDLPLTSNKIYLRLYNRQY